MRKINSWFWGMLLSLVMVMGMTTIVSADTTLSSLTVKYQNEDGTTKELALSPEFSKDVTEYTATVKSSVTKIDVDAKTSDSNATAKVEWTSLDTGDNKTYVTVTDSTGAAKKYTINTKRLTTAEDETYVEPSTKDSKKAKKSKVTVKVGKKTMYIAKSLGKVKIPEGFAEGKYTYKKKEYPCITGNKKELTALYLTPKKSGTEGFYIYDENKDTFYAMNNIQIRSRMYTIVQPEKTDKCLKNYKKKNVTIMDSKVKAWVLNSEEKLYLVYAMNWDGDVNLYCYDDNEKCFQRYLADNDVNTQLEAANTAYNKLQSKYNKLVDKYNVFVKVVAILVMIIIILIFVICNLVLNKKEKNALKSKENFFDDNGNAKKEEINEQNMSLQEDNEEEFVIDMTDEVKKEMEAQEKALAQSDGANEKSKGEVKTDDKTKKATKNINVESDDVKEAKTKKTQKYVSAEFNEDVEMVIDSKGNTKKNNISDDDEDFMFIDLD